MRSLPPAQIIEPGQAVRPKHTASPSIVKLLALSRSAAAAIAGNLVVQSFALRQ